jgi:tetratricopeptide (TPR) repeat protein
VIGVSSDPKGDLERADELESKALSLDPDNSYAHLNKGAILRAQGRADEAVAEGERALALDPSNMLAASDLGFDYIRLGEFDKSIEYFDKAIRGSPSDPSLGWWYGGKAEADFRLKNYDQAIDQARRSITIKPNYAFSHLLLMAALALTGHDAQAREALRRYLALPDSGSLKTIAPWKAHQASIGGDPRFAEKDERLYDGLRKAGMPEE